MTGKKKKPVEPTDSGVTQPVDKLVPEGETSVGNTRATGRHAGNSDAILLKVIAAIEGVNKSIEDLNVNMVNFATSNKSAFVSVDAKVNAIGAFLDNAKAQAEAMRQANPAIMAGAAQQAAQPGVAAAGAPQGMSAEQVAKLSPADRQAYAMQQLQNNPFVGMIVSALMQAGGFGTKTPNMFEEIGKRQVLMGSYTQMMEQRAIIREWTKQGKIKPDEAAKHEQMASTLYSDIERMAAAGSPPPGTVYDPKFNPQQAK